MVVLNTTQTVNGVVPECLCRVQGDIEVHICELFHLATCVEHVPQRQVTQIHISYCAVRFQWLGQWSIEFQAIHMDHCLIEGNSPIFFTVLWVEAVHKGRAHIRHVGWTSNWTHRAREGCSEDRHPRNKAKQKAAKQTGLQRSDMFECSRCFGFGVVSAGIR